MSAPKVYAAISAVAADFARTGIAKSQTNAQDQYQFRGIDDVYNRLSPILATHKLCILPRVIERTLIERSGTQGALLISVSVKTAFDLVSAEDGSVHVIESYGEAVDGGDKATSKAMTAAFKYAVLQAFCIPVNGMEDADAKSHQLRKNDHVEEPVQGWEQWSRDIVDVVRVCETGQALDRLQNINRALLRSIALERPDFYSKIGEAIRERRAGIAPQSSKPPGKNGGARRSAPRPKSKSKANGAGGSEQKANGGAAHAES